MRSVIVLLVLLTSCQWSEDRFAKRPVSAEELVGNWVGTDYSMKSLKDLGVMDHLNREEHRLVLRAHGTCSIHTTFGLPPEPNSPAVFRSYDDCRWTLEPWESAHRNRQTLRLELPGPDTSVRFQLAEEEGHLIIWQYVADPDAWRYLEFAKSPGAETPR